MSVPGTPLARARQAVALLRSALAAAPPAAVPGADARALAEAFALAERVAAAGTALYARTVASTAAHEGSGHRDAAGWLAAVAGQPVGKARQALETAERVVEAPQVERAFRDGRLSPAQAQVVSAATAADPGAAGELLATAEAGSFRELQDVATRVTRRAHGEEAEQAKEARAHARRYCRTWAPEAGGLRVEAWLTRRDGARLLARLEREADAVFDEARSAGGREPHERYLADALVRLVCGGAAGSLDAHVVVRVDAAALRRGAVAAGERCEIPGVGQVPVATARDLLGDGLLSLVVTDGADVRCVTGTRRTVPRALRIALAERDPTCVVPGCRIADHLEIDHWRVDYARGGPTSLDNLARLCGRHHAMKTTLGWRLAGGPGRWRWLPPRGRMRPGSGRDLARPARLTYRDADVREPSRPSAGRADE